MLDIILHIKTMKCNKNVLLEFVEFICVQEKRRKTECESSLPLKMFIIAQEFKYVCELRMRSQFLWHVSGAELGANH